MALFTEYDPLKVVLTWNGILVVGYMDGTFIVPERTEDAFTPQVGANGDVTRVRSRDRTGTVTVTLQAASPTNDSFSAQALVDEQFGTATGPLMLKDLNGNTLLLAATAWIQKFANPEYADEGSGREWILACAELEMFVGGSVI